MTRRSYLTILGLAIALALPAVGCGEDPAANQGGGNDGGTQIKPPPTRPNDGGSGGEGGGGEGGAGGGEETREVRLDSIHPPRGMVGGGEAVVLKGEGFLDQPGRPDASGTQVLFGSNPAIGVRVIDDTTINLRTPVGLAGDADVTIVNRLGEAVCEACFRFLEAVELHGIEPSEGPVSGGTAITIRGSGLREGMVVTVGERAAIDVQRQEDGSLRAILPPAQAEGPADVRVFDEEGQDWLRRGFTYVDRLAIESIEPPGGPLVGGNRIELRGKGFTPSAEVYVDGVRVEASLDTPGVLSLLAPKGSQPGAVALEVVTGAGEATGTYAYFDPADTTPRLYAVTPSEGPLEGGTEVTLVGTGLDHGLLAVRFDGVLAPSASASNANVVRVVTPAGSAPRAVDVEARVVAGADLLEAAFRYVMPAQIHSVDPSVGPAQGGTSIALMGAFFPEGARVFIGALEAKHVVRVSPTLITAVTPKGSVGSVPVRVLPPEGDDGEAVLADGFTYEDQLSLAVVEPPHGARAGGTLVTLRGSGFSADMPVYFGSTAAPEVEIRDPFTAIAKTPQGDVGIVDVTMGDPAGVHATLPQSFSYVDPSSSSGGASGGPLNGTLNVTVLDGGQFNFGAPVGGALVILGSDDGLELQGTTNELGQVTISSPLLVKPQVVTVMAPKYEIATISQQQSENLTVLLEPNDGGGEPGPPPPMPEPGIVRGKIWGFKRPANRELLPVEREIAMVSVSYPNVFSAPPFRSGSDPLQVTAEGGEYAFSFMQPRRVAISAVYGILDESTGIFEPLLMGIARGVEVQLEQTVYADVILDMRLDMKVPFTLLNAQPGGSEVFAYIDLGSEGVIPVANALVAGTNGQLERLPRLAGENFLFQTWSYQFFGYYPISVHFRRQAGDLTKGLTIGPMMGSLLVTRPLPNTPFTGVLEWTLTAGPPPEIVFVRIELPGMMGPIPFWHMVLPGNERRVTVPMAALAELRSRFPPGEPVQLTVTIHAGREPLFGYDQWTYRDTSLSSYTSFAYDFITVQL